MEKTLVKLFRKIAREYPDVAYQMYKHEGIFTPISYKDAYADAVDFAGGLLSLGIKRGDHIGLISDNRWEWEHADMGIMAIGAIDVPRGCDATVGDLSYILSFAECRTVVVENTAQILKVLGLLSARADGAAPADSTAHASTAPTDNTAPAGSTAPADSAPLADNAPLVITRLIAFDEPSDKAAAAAKDAGVELLTFADVVAAGKAYNAAHAGAVDAEIDKGAWDDIVTIIFTSGTTGQPKGVMLSNGNFITQLDEVDERIFLYPGDRGIMVLPVWHAFQRAVEYVVLSQAATICYSKPVGAALLADIKALNPQVLPAVPRVFEAVYDGIWRQMRKTGGAVYLLFRFFVRVSLIHSKIDRVLFDKTARFGLDKRWLQWPGFVIPWLALYPIKLLGSALVFRKIRAMLGTSFRAGVAGGGALPPNVDKFFWAVGIKLVEGYGLTETAPIISVRPIKAPVFGTVGSAVRGISARVVDVATGKDVGRGKKGVLQIKGGTVMKGYYKRDDLTAAAIDEDGWFNTGDLAMLTRHNEIKLCGRAKDTIVQSGGENVEPLPLEMKIQESRFVQAAVVVGNDQRYLAALIVPEKDEVEAFARESGLAYKSYRELLRTAEIQHLIENEVGLRVNAKNGFKMYERINKVALLEKPFEVGVELSAKQEIMRYRINELYAKEIKALYK